MAAQKAARMMAAVTRGQLNERVPAGTKPMCGSDWDPPIEEPKPITLAEAGIDKRLPDGAGKAAAGLRKTRYEQDEKVLADFARARGGNRRCRTVANSDSVAGFL